MGVTHLWREAVASFDEPYFKKIKKFYLDYKNAALPRKVKEMIIMSVCTAMARFGGTRLHLNLGACQLCGTGQRFWLKR